MDTNLPAQPENKEPLSSDENLDISPAMPGFSQSASEAANQMEAELRLTLEEIARLQNALAEANMKILALKNSNENEKQQILIEGKDIINPLVQELFQPVHTIKGYLDLLLNESVGVLGTFQKRFIERISSSVDHMEELLKSLESLTGDEAQSSEDFSKVFSLAESIDSGISIFTDQIRSKSITLKVSIETKETDFCGDKDLFERALNILLSNACMSVNTEGTIHVSLKELKGNDPKQFLLDIQTYDLNNAKSKPQSIFLDEIKDQRITLPGFGLPIKDLKTAKMLTEKMHGVMEIFSIPENGSLVRLRLPIIFKDVLA